MVYCQVARGITNCSTGLGCTGTRNYFACCSSSASNCQLVVSQTGVAVKADLSPSQMGLEWSHPSASSVFEPSTLPSHTQSQEILPCPPKSVSAPHPATDPLSLGTITYVNMVLISTLLHVLLSTHQRPRLEGTRRDAWLEHAPAVGQLYSITPGASHLLNTTNTAMTHTNTDQPKPNSTTHRTALPTARESQQSATYSLRQQQQERANGNETATRKPENKHTCQCRLKPS